MSYFGVVDWHVSLLQVWDWQEERWFMVASHLRFTSLNIIFECSATGPGCKRISFTLCRPWIHALWSKDCCVPRQRRTHRVDRVRLVFVMSYWRLKVHNHHYQPKGPKQSVDHCSWTFGKLQRLSLRWDGVNLTGNSSSWVGYFSFPKLYQNVKFFFSKALSKCIVSLFKSSVKM